MLYGTLKYIWVWLFFFQAEGSPRCLFRLPHLVHIYVDIRMLDFIVLVKKISGLYSTLGCYHNFQLLNFSNFLIMSPRSQKVCNHLFSQSLFAELFWMVYPFMFCCESVNFFPCGPLVFKNSHRCPPRQLMSVDSLCCGGLSLINDVFWAWWWCCGWQHKVLKKIMQKNYASISSKFY